MTTGFQGSTRLGQFYFSPETIVKRTIGGTKYLFGFSCAENAMGLIGSENNGIAVVNETKKDVVLDMHLRIDSGYFGPEPAHLAEVKRLRTMTARDFLAFIATHPRTRVQYRANPTWPKETAHA